MFAKNFNLKVMLFVVLLMGMLSFVGTRQTYAALICWDSGGCEVISVDCDFYDDWMGVWCRNS